MKGWRIGILLWMVLLGSASAWCRDLADSVSVHITDTVTAAVTDNVAVDLATTPEKRDWIEAIKQRNYNINDTNIVYPKFPGFCVDVYRWVDHALNYYDSTYVVSPKQKWKLMLKNNNWLDLYAGELGPKHMRVQMNSDVTSLFGVQIAYMAVSLSYMMNVRDIIEGKFIRNRRLAFSFTSSRAALDVYYDKNDESSVNMHRLGHWRGNTLFYGLKRESYGLDAYYIFNHTHYAQAAAYCFSKYQKRSAGSLLAGIYLSHQDVVMDFSTLEDEHLKAQLPDGVTDYRFRYRDFGALIGYGYSWVFHHGWVYNITVTPSIGFRESFSNSIEGKKNLLSTNLTGRMALVRYAGHFFYGLHLKHDGHWYRSNDYSFYNCSNNLDIIAGFRF